MPHVSTLGGVESKAAVGSGLSCILRREPKRKARDGAELRLLVSFTNRGLGGKSVRDESIHEVELVAQPLGELAENADTRLAPSRGAKSWG